MAAGSSHRWRPSGRPGRGRATSVRRSPAQSIDWPGNRSTCEPAARSRIRDEPGGRALRQALGTDSARPGARTGRVTIGGMEFQDVVRRRKMIRRYADRPVDRAVVDRMLSNGVRAPSAGFSQGWVFLVIDEPPELDRFWTASSLPESDLA